MKRLAFVLMLLLAALGAYGQIILKVDTSVVVPVNRVPVVAKTDGTSIIANIAYDTAGMDLRWNFVTTAGVVTSTAVTPTTSGVYDWAALGDGIYSMEIPNAGGGSANNDTEGFGWFSGSTTDAAAWAGPIVSFTSPNVVDSLMGVGTNLLSVNTTKLSGTALTGRDIGASVLLSPGTGTGQISLTSGAVTVGTNNDKSGYTASTVSDKTGYSLAASQAGVTIGTVTTITNGVNVASISGDSTAADNAELFFDGTGYAGGTIKLGVNAVQVSGATPDTAATLTDAVLNEALSGHATAGTVGKGIADASSAGDPWGTAIPGEYGAGTAGKIIGDNLNAPVDTIDTVVDAIKVKTDYLPSATAGGAGGVFIAGSNAATSITTALTANVTGNITGNLSGSVGSVTGAVGSVTGAVGSVTGAVGSVTGAVGSVTSKTGFSLAADQSAVTIGTVNALAANSVNASAVADNAIDAGAIAASAIGASEIATAAIDADALAADFLAAINAEVVDVTRTDTLTLPGKEAPTATPTFSEAVAWLYKIWRNKKDSSATVEQYYADDGTTADVKRTHSAAAGTTTVGEMTVAP